MKKIINIIKKNISKFEPKTQRNIIIGSCLIVVIIAILILSPRKKESKVINDKAVKEYSFRDEGIDHAFNYKILDETSNLKKELESLKAEKKKLEKERESLQINKKKFHDAYKNPEEKVDYFSKLKNSDSDFLKVPPAPKKSKVDQEPAIPTLKDKIFKQYNDYTPPPPQVKLILEGGIVSNPLTDDELETAEKEKKRESKKKSIYLPPSFVKANLLTGIVSSTVHNGQGETSPMILRIQDLAILPNNVKANLKGCFIIGEGSGNIATERVKARLTTLSCVDLKGNAVIEESVSGWIVDSDGKVGLKGRVVAKMGAHLLRTFWASFIGGVGSGLSSSAKDFSFTDSGNINAIMSDQDLKSGLKSGLGEGLDAATKSLKKFYLDLAEQTMPVIEVGATKDVTVVFSKGIELKIQEKMLEGVQ